ncbi:hypothetical protein J2S11_003641 [Bacillus horti]|uniref:Uncharacterized protein n=1 Tax=Caldalkalibacillus horti TaxID=77523 RepID=A0ABT9W3A2_9BACI|nr:hypothetical protein [Bacillus horti]
MPLRMPFIVEPVAQILDKQVFGPLGFRESGWYPRESSKLVDVFNSFGSPEGFDYLADIRSFGNISMQCFITINYLWQLLPLYYVYNY